MQGGTRTKLRGSCARSSRSWRTTCRSSASSCAGLRFDWAPPPMLASSNTSSTGARSPMLAQLVPSGWLSYLGVEVPVRAKVGEAVLQLPCAAPGFALAARSCLVLSAWQMSSVSCLVRSCMQSWGGQRLPANPALPTFLFGKKQM